MHLGFEVFRISWGWEGKEREKSNAFRFCQEKSKRKDCEKQNNISIREGAGKHAFQEAFTLAGAESRLKGADSHSESRRLGPQTIKINQPSGKQVTTQTGGRVSLP